MRLLKPLDCFRKELAHMLHSRRKAEIEVLVDTSFGGSMYPGSSGQPLFLYLTDKISVTIDGCNGAPRCVCSP